MQHIYALINDYNQQLMGPYRSDLMKKLPKKKIVKSRTKNLIKEDSSKEKSLDVLENEGGPQNVPGALNQKDFNALVCVQHRVLMTLFGIHEERNGKLN